MNPEKPHQRAARLLTNLLNPFFVFTALYALVAFSTASISGATIYVLVELAAVGDDEVTYG